MTLAEFLELVDVYMLAMWRLAVRASRWLASLWRSTEATCL